MLLSGDKVRLTCNVAFNAFVAIAMEMAEGEWISVRNLKKVAQAVMSAGGPLEQLYQKEAEDWAVYYEQQKILSNRSDSFGRLVVHTFAPLFDDHETLVTRKILPRFFSALHLILGDTLLFECKEKCTTIADRIRQDKGDKFVWADLYDDKEAITVLDTVLVSVARSFRRFDVRKEWFFKVMNHEQSSVSLSSNAFIPIKRDNTIAESFSERQFLNLFRALFSFVETTKMVDERRNRFIKHFHEKPEDVFGSLFIALTRLEQSL